MSVHDRKLTQADPARGMRLLADAAAAAESSRLRVDTAAIDLVTPRGSRIDAATRMELARLLADLTAAIEDDLRERLIALWRNDAPAGLIESLAAGDVAIAAPILDRARVLGDRELVAALLRQVEMRRMADRSEASPRAQLLDTLMQSGDEPLAALVMALLVARSRRDAATGAGPATTDLPAELQHRLVWRVAAALRHHVLARGMMAEAAVDRALVAAATAALSGYDEEDTLDGRAMQVARRMHQRRRLDDALIARGFTEGELAFAVAALAVRVSIDFAHAWDMVADPGGSRLALLLRATGVGRGAAAEIVAALAPAGQGDAEAWLDGYDWLDPLAAREAMRAWQVDGGYRAALAELADGLAGERHR